jgi:hypothetical protein
MLTPPIQVLEAKRRHGPMKEAVDHLWNTPMIWKRLINPNTGHNSAGRKGGTVLMEMTRDQAIEEVKLESSRVHCDQGVIVHQ